MNRFFSTLQALSPILEAAHTKAPRADELLFGEVCECTGEDGNYYKIRHLWNASEGYILKNQLAEVDATYAGAFAKGEWQRLFAPSARIENERSGLAYTLTAGSILPMLSNNRFSLAGEQFLIDPPLAGTSPVLTSDIIRDAVLLFLNVPESHGGRSIMGIDPALFCQHIFGFAGIRLPPELEAMASAGTHVDFVHELKCGDLAFFSDADGRIIHAGIGIDDGWMIHCDGKVKSGRLDQQGLFDPRENRYIYQLRLIKRYF